MKGRKFDSKKLRWSLLPWDALAPVVRVLEFGCKKYKENNWMKVEGGYRRYRDAALRHLIALDSGQTLDPETGEHHLAHALCSCLFALHHHQNASKLLIRRAIPKGGKKGRHALS